MTKKQASKRLRDNPAAKAKYRTPATQYPQSRGRDEANAEINERVARAQGMPR